MNKNMKTKIWESSQEEEKNFWVDISKNGYMGSTTDDFIFKNQKNFMRYVLSFVDMSQNYWDDKIVVEVGSGPAGIIEYISSRHKYAIEPLIDTFKKHYPHLKSSTVKYFPQPAEIIPLPDKFSDLVICHNVLDHVMEPYKVLNECSRIIKEDGYFLFQVNIYKDPKLKTEQHKALHPHTFTEDSICEILEKNKFRIFKRFLSDKENAEGEFYFLILAKRFRKGILKSICEYPTMFISYIMKEHCMSKKIKVRLK